MPPFERASSPTLSMREKSLLKRRVNKEHNSNFRAGYVNVNEEQLHKTGIRGRKRYVVCVITALLAIAVIINLLITICILAVLGIGKDGLGSLEFIPRSQLLRFLGKSEMGQVSVIDPVIGSLPNGAIKLTGEEGGKVEMKINKKGGSKVTVRPSGTTLQSRDGFEVLDPDSGKLVFSTDPDKQKMLTDRIKSVRHLRTEQVVTDRVTSSTKARLRVESPGRMALVAGGGTSLRGRQVTVSGRDSVNIWSSDDIVIDGGTATRLSFYKGLPIKDSRAPPRANVTTYKLCVGSPEGTLYSIPWNGNCAQ